MLGKLAGWEDTIVALATPPGIGAIGVIRMSGPAAFGIVGGLFPAKDLRLEASHTLHVGILKEGEEVLDEVVVSLFRGPRSYTGENVVEISCHGSPYVIERVIQALLHGGARLARAGEFTQRAFLNGKLDLAQAEAVADLIASNTAASARTALHTIRGGFSLVLRELREQLISFSALIELELDFSQEDVEFADRTQLYHLIQEAETVTGELLSSFRLGNVIRNGVSVAIVGKPNAGKSTLLNVLLNEDRAIVSEIAGTTRDTIEEVLNIDGILFRLIDTAGIREHTSDVIESMGVGKSLAKMEQADIVVYMFDVNDEVEEVVRRRGVLEGGDGATGAGVGGTVGAGAVGGETGGGEAGTAGAGGVGVGATGATGAGAGRSGAGGGGVVGTGAVGTGAGATGPGGSGTVGAGAGGGAFGSGTGDSGTVAGNGSVRDKRFLWVANKVDALSEDVARRKFNTLPDAIFISARRHEHIDILRQRLVDQVLQGRATGDGTIVTNARHYHALQQVAASLAVIHKGLDELLPGDLLALDIRHCLHYLGEITGEITTEDRLDYIFSKFCIGK